MKRNPDDTDRNDQWYENDNETYKQVCGLSLEEVNVILPKSLVCGICGECPQTIEETFLCLPNREVKGPLLRIVRTPIGVDFYCRSCIRSITEYLNHNPAVLNRAKRIVAVRMVIALGENLAYFSINCI